MTNATSFKTQVANGQLLEKINGLLASPDRLSDSAVFLEALNLLVKCLNNFRCVRGDVALLHSLRSLAANLEANAMNFDGKAPLSIFSTLVTFGCCNAASKNGNSMEGFELDFANALLVRAALAANFSLLNKMPRDDRRQVESRFFSKMNQTMSRAAEQLLSKVDYEIKISLVELLWRGARRLKSPKTAENFNLHEKLSLKGISELKADDFEADATQWLKVNKCLTPELGYYKLHGKLVLAVSTKDKRISEYDVGEIILTSCILRVHMTFVGSSQVVKAEIPVSHLVGLTVDKDRIDLSCKLDSDHFNAIWLWSPKVQEAACAEITEAGFVSLRFTFGQQLPESLAESLSGLAKVVNDVMSRQSEYDSKPISNKDSSDLIDAWGSCKDNFELNPLQELAVPASVGLSGRRKVVDTRELDWDMDCDLQLSKSKGNQLALSSPSIIESTVDSCYTSNLSDDGSCYNKPFRDPLLEHAQMTLNPCDSIEDEPLMLSLRNYRQAKSRELLSSFRKAYHEEWEAIKVEINQLSHTQAVRRSKLQSEYKKQVNVLVSEIEEHHQQLLSQLKVEAVRNECNKSKQWQKLEARHKFGDVNILVSNSKDLVASTDKALEAMNETIQKIKRHYIRKRADCSKALKSIYVG